VLGTPAYMAPEQFVSDSRDYGPPTDLYALGCVAYALVCGAPPYGRTAEVQLMHELHQEAVIPPLDPRSAVPEGFERWVHQLLAKKPSQRFQFAADALAVLEELGEPEGSITAPLADGFAPESALSSSIITMASELCERDPSSSIGGPMDSFPPPRPRTALPASWRRASPAGPRIGLGLYGLRQVPLVGREEERDRLWSELRDVVNEGDKRWVLLTGPAGCGKSRLAQWLCERAHEAGAAVVLKAVHGLGAMVARYLRCEGLERPQLFSHVERRLLRLGAHDLADTAALAELAVPDDEESVAGRVRFASLNERYVLVTRLVRRISRTRPVILWLDDADEEALGFARHVMESDDPMSVLLLLTGSRLELSQAVTIDVQPLPETEWPELVARLMRLDPALAARVAERTRGNPLFALQLVGSWVDRGLLEATHEGFRLRAGVELELPEELEAMWRERIDRLLRSRPITDELALELAAVLGEHIASDEWKSACAVSGLSAPEGLVEELLSRRLAVADSVERWSFVHGMLREALERRAAQAGRAAAHHRACAHMLRSRRGTGIAERLARHLSAAGDRRLALTPLRDAARERLDRGEYVLSDRLITAREDTLVELKSEEADVNWAEGWILRGEVALKRGQLEVGMKWASLAAKAAADHGWPRLRAEALGLRARIERLLGSIPEAEEDLRAAEQLCRDTRDRKLLADILQTRGRLLVHRGELAEARNVLGESHEVYRLLGEARGVAEARWSLAHLETYFKDYDQALLHNDAALEALRQWGDRWGVARCLNTAGEITRILGQLDAAERHYREARDLMSALGAKDSAAICESNIARVQAERGIYSEARVRLERSRPAFERGRRDALAWLYVVLLMCDAGQRDWSNWDNHWSIAQSLLRESGYLDLDIPTVAEMAATLAHEAGEASRAAPLYELAHHQWTSLGHAPEAERIARFLSP